MEKKEFIYENKLITYETIDGGTFSIYVNSEDMETYGEHWDSLADVEKCFDEMLDQCGSDCNAKNRSDLFIFMYAVSKNWIK